MATRNARGRFQRRTSRTSSKGPTFIQRARAISSEQKAIYHQVAGAGKSQVRREFFDLNEQDVEAIALQIDAHVQLVIDRAS